MSRILKFQKKRIESQWFPGYLQHDEIELIILKNRTRTIGIESNFRICCFNCRYQVFAMSEIESKRKSIHLNVWLNRDMIEATWTSQGNEKKSDIHVWFDSESTAMIIETKNTKKSIRWLRIYFYVIIYIQLWF